MSDSPSWDLLVVGDTILTMEPGCEPMTDGAVAVADGHIAAVGPADELRARAPGVEELDARGCLVLPGLVNTHSHLAMTLMRGIADDLPMKSWLFDRVWPTEERHIDREAVRRGTELAVVEQLLAGVTTTTDMYFFEDEVGAVLDRAGMRAVIGESLMERPTPSCATTEEMLERQRALAELYADHPLITPAVASHAPYSVSAPNMVLEAELAEELGVPLLVHLAETRWEVDTLLADKGVSPVAYLADLGILSERVVAAHCVHVSPEDIELLAEFEVGVAHNPVSNLKLASGVCPVSVLLEHGVPVGLGTDGPASNNTLDLLRDLQVAALLHKGVTGDPTVLPARTLVEIATSGGARILGIDDRVGMLAPGLEADLVCLDITGAHATPLVDPFSHLVFSARSADVRHVVVRGRRLVVDRKLTTLDVERVKARAREAATGFTR